MYKVKNWSFEVGWFFNSMKRFAFKDIQEGVIWVGNLFFFTLIDEIFLKCDFIDGSNVNGIRWPMWKRLALDKPPGYKLVEFRRATKFKKVFF